MTMLTNVTPFQLPSASKGRGEAASSVASTVHDATAGTAESDGSLDAILAQTERREILEALQRSGGRRAWAARLLRISRSRLYRRMGALGITSSTGGQRESA